MFGFIWPRLLLAIRFFRYRINAVNAHEIHSPFVFELYTKVICSKNKSEETDRIERRRQRLQTDTREIEVTDFGAGATSSRKTIPRKINYIANSSVKSPKYGQLLHRLIHHFSPQIALELGTSLGITTAYLATGAPNATIYTFEGCPEVSKIAKETFNEIGVENAIQVLGNLDNTLPETLGSISKVDFVFFDGNHRLEPTMRYFEQCLAKAHEESVFIFDDLNWSNEMRESWQQIKEHPEVKLTIDLFFIGLVFFRNKQPKQHFVLKF